MLLLALQVLVLLVLSYKRPYPQAALSRWGWAFRWEMACQGEVLVDLLESLVLSQGAGVALEVAPCPWAAGVTAAEEATMTWMLLKTSVVYLIMAICSFVCVFCVWSRHYSHLLHHAEFSCTAALIAMLVRLSTHLADVGTQHKPCKQR